jgi:hypothetical protein
MTARGEESAGLSIEPKNTFFSSCQSVAYAT